MADISTIQVKVDVTIDRPAVEKCLKIIEMWLNDNPDKAIHGGTRLVDGTVEPLIICEREG